MIPLFQRKTDFSLTPGSCRELPYCIVQETEEIGSSAEGFIEGPVVYPKGERLDVEPIAADGQKRIRYRADFSKYKALAKDGFYAVYFVAELSNGLTYCTEGSSILEFNYSSDNRSSSGGSADFVPILE